MSLYSPPFDTSQEPSPYNVRQWLGNLKTKLQPAENARWNQAHIDSLFYAGSQDYVNRYFGYSGRSTTPQFYFNLCQNPINMVTGYERQNRKGWMYQATEGGDDQTADQYTKLITHCANVYGLHEAKSKAKELAAISGLVLVQPYLDFDGDDQAQGSPKAKIWEYNSFMTDSFWRDPSMSDCQTVWCQEYISRKEALNRFGEKAENLNNFGPGVEGYGDFYFLPENYSMNRSDLRILSYVWYKWKKKKKRLYSESRNQFFDFAGGDNQLEQILFNIPDMQEVNVETPCWRCCTILNDQLISQADNPLGDFMPFVPYFWNRDPHLSQYELQVRSLIRPMRDPQFLFNYKVIQNNDIAAATINQGWKRKVGAVANEDNLKKSGSGWDVIINEGFELTDCEKIIPSAVPESDLALAEQFRSLIFATSAIDLENWAGQQDKQISSLTMMLKQASNLMVFQKYFDQWDYSDMLLGDKFLQMLLNGWNAAKVALMIGEEPSPYFYSKIFSKYKVIVEECDLTPTQQNLTAHRMLEINAAFQRDVFSPSQIIPKLNITGKSELIPMLQQQEQQAAEVQQHATTIQHTVEEAKIKELYSKIAGNVATARERHSRSDSNVGLLEERMAQVTKDRASATKERMEALEKLIDVVAKYGEIETALKMQEIESFDQQQVFKEDREKVHAQRTSGGNKFLAQLMGGSEEAM